MQNNELVSTVLNQLEALKGLDMTLLDVKSFTSITDYMIVVSGTSGRHVQALADKLIQHMKAHHLNIQGMESDGNQEWILVDLGDIVVHIMQQKAREFYQLEKLWSSPPSVSLKQSLR